jgi:DNA-binding transcriptional regulator LsrR (DeoR family)
MSEQPPPEIAHFVEALGEPATLRLIEEFGGTRLYVPTGDRAIADLGRRIGIDGAQALRVLCGYDRIRVPVAKAWRARIYRARGMSCAEIARKLGMTEKHIQTLAASPAAGSARAVPGQLALPLRGPRAGA